MSAWEFLWCGVGARPPLSLRVREGKFIATDDAGPVRHVGQLRFRGVGVTTIHIPRSREVPSERAESSDERASGDVYIPNHVQREAVLHDYQREKHKVGCELHEVYGA